MTLESVGWCGELATEQRVLNIGKVLEDRRLSSEDLDGLDF